LVAAIADGVAIIDASGAVRAHFPGCAVDARFAPDGSAMAVLGCPEGLMAPGGDPEAPIFWWDLNGDTVRKLAAGPFDSIGLTEDGKAIALGGRHSAHLINVEKGNTLFEHREAERRISEVQTAGEGIAFKSGNYFRYDRSRKLTWSGVLPDGCYTAVWSPDGRRFAYHCSDWNPDAKPRAAWRLIIASETGNGAPLCERVVARRDRLDEYSIAWSHDSQRIAITSTGTEPLIALVDAASCAPSTEHHEPVAAVSADLHIGVGVKGGKLWWIAATTGTKKHVPVAWYPAILGRVEGTLLLENHLAYAPATGKIADAIDVEQAARPLPRFAVATNEGNKPFPYPTDERGYTGVKPSDVAGSAIVLLAEPKRGAAQDVTLVGSAELAAQSATCRFSLNGAYVIGDQFEDQFVWDARTGKLVLRAAANWVDVGPDGRRALASMTDNGTCPQGVYPNRKLRPCRSPSAILDVYSLPDGKRKSTLKDMPLDVMATRARWSADGARAVVPGVGVLDVAGGRWLWRGSGFIGMKPDSPKAETPWVNGDALVRHRAVGGDESNRTGMLEVVAARDGSPIAALEGAYRVIDRSEDGRVLLTSDAEPGRNLRVWDTHSWKLIAALQNEAYGGAAIAPDGRFIYRQLDHRIAIDRISDGATIYQVVPVELGDRRNSNNPADAGSYREVSHWPLSFTHDGRFDGSPAAVDKLVGFRFGGARTGAMLGAKRSAAQPCSGLAARFFAGEPLACGSP
jgi:hypothetical protein